jgi:hypothetical protein
MLPFADTSALHARRRPPTTVRGTFDTTMRTGLRDVAVAEGCCTGLTSTGVLNAVAVAVAAGGTGTLL